MSSTLTIARLNSRYTIPHEHPHPERVRMRLDDAVHQEGTAVISHLLERSLDEQDPSIWLIRRLNLEMIVNVGASGGLSRDELGRMWGQQATASLLRAIARGPDGQNVCYFPNRAAYVAQFVTDVANGTADDKWYYADFAGLRHLLTTQAIREAIVREKATGVAILLLLVQTKRLEKVLHALSPPDAARLYQICQEQEPATAAASRQTWAQVLALWPKVVVQVNGRYATPHNQLRLWLNGRIHAGETAVVGQHDTILHILHLADLLYALPDPLILVRHLSQGELGAALALTRQQGIHTGLESLQAWQEAAANDPSWLEEVARTLLPKTTTHPFTDTAASVTKSYPSLVGGIFLLLPIMLDLHLPEHWLYWLALKCLGGAHADQWRDDPILLLALGLNAVPDSPATITPNQLHTLRQEWQAILRHQGRADGRFLALETVPDFMRHKSVEEEPAQTVIVLHDMQFGYWLDIGSRDDVQASIDELEAARVWDGGERPEWVETAVPDYAAKAKPAAPALAYFALPDLPSDLDLTLTLLAQGILHTFARHMPGFAWSSPAYLYHNFLAGQSSIEITATEIRVLLPSSPLHTVIRMTGLQGSRYTLPWLDDRTVILEFP